MVGVQRRKIIKVSTNSRPRVVLYIVHRPIVGKIKAWGYCSLTCKDNNNSFMYANMNVLTDEECNILMEQDREENEYEICAGKKHMMPNSVISFKRRQKKPSFLKRQQEGAEKYGFPKAYHPTPYSYSFQKASKVHLGTPKDYPFKWFMGGVDSCQGDSGGPLWRNVKANRYYLFYEITEDEINVLSSTPLDWGSIKGNTNRSGVTWGWVCRLQ